MSETARKFLQARNTNTSGDQIVTYTIVMVRTARKICGSRQAGANRAVPLNSRKQGRARAPRLVPRLSAGLLTDAATDRHHPIQSKAGRVGSFP